MKNMFVEHTGKGKRAYSTTLVDPKNIGVVTNKLALEIIKELSKKPACAMDVARALEQHEQKVYYHINRLAAAGIIRPVSTEKRYGMVANMFTTVSPVVAAKLYDDGQQMEAVEVEETEPSVVLKPFVSDGRLDALVIMGDTYSHGKYDMYSTEGPHAFDLALLLGKHLKSIAATTYKLDTQTSKEELRGNLILIGHPQTNVIIERINTKLPVFFEEKDDWSIVSKATGAKYRDPREGVIIKCPNPFNPEKSILVFAGRTRGTQAAILAFTKYFDTILKDATNYDSFVRVVKGFDKNGDGVIDTIKVLE